MILKWNNGQKGAFNIPKRELSPDVLEKVNGICAESNLEILDSNVDRAHLIGTNYNRIKLELTDRTLARSRMQKHYILF